MVGVSNGFRVWGCKGIAFQGLCAFEGVLLKGLGLKVSRTQGRPSFALFRV